MNKLILATVLLLGLVALPSAHSKQYVGYYQSWTDANADGLSKLPPYVTTVILSFMQPDNSYAAGSMDLTTTGLQFTTDGNTLLQAIQTAQANGAQVLVAVGGASYTNWAGLNAAGVGAFVTDFGLNGVDIDYEPAGPACTAADGGVSCPTDQEMQDVVNAIRGAVPAPAIASLAAFSVGAFGQGDFAGDGSGSPSAGIAVNLLNSDAGKSLDQVNIMAYDVGTGFDPTRAFSAYKSLFGGAITLGVEVPPEAWGDHVVSIDEVNGLADFVNGNGGDNDGMMIWSLNRLPAGDVSPTNPDPTLISQAICAKFGLQQCDAGLDIPMAAGKALGSTVSPAKPVKSRRRCLRR